MNKKYMFALIAVLVLFLIAWVGVSIGLQWLFGVAVPYLAVLLFVVGFARKVLGWSRSAVPFAIPTTGGQAKSFDWIPDSKFDNPSSKFGLFMRMVFEVLTFRSLFRNTRAKLRPDGRLVYSADKTLWAIALAFHWSLLVVLLRHYRFFVEPPPAFVAWLQGLDGFFQVGVPEIYLTDIVIVAALGTLLLRRLLSPRIRYISLAADYFPLFLLLGVTGTGVLMRYFDKTNLVAAKELALGLVRLNPTTPEGIGPLFLTHLVLVSILFAYLPFSKLTHMAGVFLSPTRNLANTNRIARHVNPWDHPVGPHTYEEWEEEFHDKLVAAGIPLDGE
jgi:nitrate reductase gamma subunit